MLGEELWHCCVAVVLQLNWIAGEVSEEEVRLTFWCLQTSVWSDNSLNICFTYRVLIRNTLYEPTECKCDNFRALLSVSKAIVGKSWCSAVCLQNTVNSYTLTDHLIMQNCVAQLYWFTFWRFALLVWSSCFHWNQSRADGSPNSWQLGQIILWFWTNYSNTPHPELWPQEDHAGGWKWTLSRELAFISHHEKHVWSGSSLLIEAKGFIAQCHPLLMTVANIVTMQMLMWCTHI